jgi:hypothetical protein
VLRVARLNRTWLTASWTNSWGTDAWGAEYKFLCVDSSGDVGIFLAAGDGAIPDGGTNSIAEMMLAVDAVRSFPEVSDGFLSFTADDPSIYADEMLFARRGIWVYDWTPPEISNEVGYFRKALPIRALHIHELPQAILDQTYVIENINFAVESTLTPPGGLVVPEH